VASSPSPAVPLNNQRTKQQANKVNKQLNKQTEEEKKEKEEEEEEEEKSRYSIVVPSK
jgi:hypothetical protein